MNIFGIAEACADALIVILTSYAGGRGVGSAPSGERDGRSPLASMQQCDSQREAAPVYRSKDIKVSTQVVIRDLFCKRRRAMLQYGTPDWARPCLARLPLAGAFVFAQLVLKRVGADHLQMLARPQHAVFCSGVCLGTGRVFSAVNLVCYLQKGAQATKLNGQCRPPIIPTPF